MVIDSIALIISGITNKASDQIKLSHSTTLRKDLGLDSLQLAQLTVEVEDKWDVDIFEDGMVETVGDIIAKITAV